MTHKAVLQKEVLEYLRPTPNENFIDCTIGEMGHTLGILERNKPSGKVLGIDWDPNLIRKLKLQVSLNCKTITKSNATGLCFKFQERIILVNDSYTNLKKIVEKYKLNPVNGILLDLGMSGWHLEKSGRGFTFLKDEPLDMRYSPDSNSLTAGIIVNKWPESEIKQILKEYGEEKFAKRIAKEIVKQRKIEQIKTTFQLIEVIKRAIPSKFQRGRIDFSTRTFQALRIAVNDELSNLKRVLPQAIEVLSPGGRIVIISFHSLEDRIVKNFFKKYKSSREATGYKVPDRATPQCSLAVGHLSCKERGPCLTILTKKPITPSQEEIKINRRSRSAKLRAAKI